MFSRLLLNSSRSAFISARNFSKVSGTVKFFDAKKGFGFISVSETGEELFVHHSSIKSDGFRSLADGEPVEFTVGIDENKGKKIALDVTGPNGAQVKGAPRVSNRDQSPRRGGRENDFNW